MWNQSKSGKNLRRARTAGRAALMLALLCGMLGGCGRFGNPSEAEMLQRAKDAFGKDQPEAAVVHLKTLLQLHPSNVEGRYLLGEVQVALKRGAAAEAELRRAIELGMPRDSVQVAMGRALLLERKYATVLREIALPANVSDAYRARIWEIQGRAQLGLGRYREGCDLIDRAVGSDKTYIPAYWGQALCAVGYGKFEDARAHLEAAQKIEPNNGETWGQIGDVARLERRFEEAEKAYATALKLKPNNIDALLGRAEVKVMTNQLKGAAEDIDAVLRIAKGQPIARHLGGVIQFKRGQYAEAKTTFEGVISSKVEYPLTYLWLGLSNFVLGNTQQASNAFQHYLQTNPPNAVEAYAALTYLQAKSIDKDSAEARLKLLSKINVDSPMALNFIGNAYLTLGQTDSAIQYLERAIKAKPQAEAYINLAGAYSGKGETAKAIEALTQAVSVEAMGARQADALLIRALVVDKRYDKALEAIDALQAKDAKSPMPHILRGQLKLAQDDEAGAVASFNKAMELSPGDVTAGNALALIAARKKDYASARNQLQTVLKQHKDDLTTLLALYSLELNANRQADALLVLEKAAATHPGASGPALLLGERYLKSGRALKTLDVTQAAASANPDDIALLEMRGAAHMALSEPANALPIYKRMAKLLPKSADAAYYVATAYAAGKDRAAYRAALASVLELDPRHFRARAALARFELQDGKPDAALRISRELQKEFPRVADAAAIESEALMAKGNKREAVAALEKFQKQNPADWAARELLVKAYLYVGDKEQALRVARDGRAVLPDRSEAYDLLGQVQQTIGDRAGALATYNDALKIYPNSAPIYVAIGFIHVAMANYSAARTAFQSALRQDAENVGAQRALASIEAQEKRYDAALDIARRMQKQQPSSAVGHVLAGDLLLAQKDYAQAARNYETATRFEQTSLIFMKLHGTLLLAGRADDADRRAVDWLREHPDDVEARRYIGDSFLRRGKNREAINQYQLVLKRDARDVLALNNLAVLYQQVRDPRAIETAERALKLRPDSPAVLDTTGWLLVEKGTLARGLDLLRQARKLAPDDSGVTYHYAAALAKSGDKTSARRELEPLLKSGKDFPEKAVAERLLRGL